MILAKLIPMNGWIVIISFILINSTHGLEWVVAVLPASTPMLPNLFAGLLTSRGLATLVCFIFLVFSLKPVWRKIWAAPWIGKILSEKIYPDLNGEWEFTMMSNWPIIEQSLAEDRRVIASRLEGNRSVGEADLQGQTFTGTIDQSWLKTKITVNPNSDSKLRRSRTVFVELIKENETENKRIAWTFRQDNVLPADTSDSGDFFGSAVLTVNEGSKSLDGQYWTNRNWEKGMNTAGLITARKL